MFESFSLESTTSAPDVTVVPFTFAATTITFKAVSDAGRELFSSMFGAGAVEVDLPKSRGVDFEVFVARKGLVIE